MRSPISAIVKSPTKASISPASATRRGRPRSPMLQIAVLLAKLLLVDLAYTGSCEVVDEQHLFGDAVFRNDALVGENFQMRFDCGIVEDILASRVFDDQRQGPFAPSLVLHANHRGFGHAGAL